MAGVIVFCRSSWRSVVSAAQMRERGRMQRTSLGWNDPRTEDGQLLCPRLFDEEQVRTMEKSLGFYQGGSPTPAAAGPKGRRHVSARLVHADR